MRKAIVMFPSFFIVIPMILNFTLDNTTYSSLKGLLIIGMVVGNPLIIALQGYLSGRLRMNFKISLGVTLVVYFIAILIFLNSSALGYPIIGGIFGVVGYLIGKRKVIYNCIK